MSSKMNFEPAPDYHNLKKQAYSLFRYARALQSEKEFWEQEVKKCDHEEVIRLKAQLESEREMNALLTKEIEQLQKADGDDLVWLIDELAENQPLYKDSGLWQIRSDDMETVLYQQKSNESFFEFITRAYKYGAFDYRV